MVDEGKPDAIANRPVTSTASRREQIEETGLFQTDGGAQLHGIDARPPVLVLAQSNNQDRYPDTGMIYRIDTMQPMESIRVIPIHVQPIRSKFPAGAYKKDRMSECMSQDGMVPVKVMPFSGELSLPYGMSPSALKQTFQVDNPEDVGCKGCPLAASDPFRSAQESGDCLPEYLTVLMDAESLEMYIMTLRRTNSRGGGILGGKTVYRQRVVEISGEHVNGPQGAYERLSFRPEWGELDEGLVDIATHLVDQFSVSEAYIASDEVVAKGDEEEGEEVDG